MDNGRYCYAYPRAALTADCVVFAREANALYLLLVRRRNEPFAGHWALPGGFMDMGETLEQCARRELHEETGLLLREPLVEVGSFSAPGRDPRGRTVSVAFAATTVVSAVHGSDDATEARWKRLATNLDADHPLFPVGLELAFDHNEMVRRAFLKLFNPSAK
ncbi:MAG: NUDIX hydrolase [Bacteroidales bacterium]|nr:NUDIX hydrolase [Bacteroidales bacterium]